MIQSTEGSADRLERLLDRLDRLEGRLATIEAAVAQVPAAVATLTDVVDDLVRRAREAGVDLDDRGRRALGLLERLSAPETVAALEALLDQLPRAAALAEQAPAMVATAVDVLDDLAGQARARGVDLETTVTGVLTVADRLRKTLDSPEVAALMTSGVLAPSTLQVLGSAGRALADVQGEGQAPRVGLFGALRASGDPDLQRALGFLLAFGRRFGGLIGPEPAATEQVALDARRQLPGGGATA